MKWMEPTCEQLGQLAVGGGGHHLRDYRVGARRSNGIRSRAAGRLSGVRRCDWTSHRSGEDWFAGGRRARVSVPGGVSRLAEKEADGEGSGQQRGCRGGENWRGQQALRRSRARNGKSGRGDLESGVDGW